MGASLSDGLRRVDWAAAIGIAAVRAGQLQKRDVAICVFDTRVVREWLISWSDRETAKRAIFDFGMLGLYGGTDFSPAYAWALDSGAEQSRSDIILVTDGFGSVSDPVLKRITEARTRGLRCWGVIAGEGGVPDALAGFVDGVATLDGSTDAADKIGSLGAV